MSHARPTLALCAILIIAAWLAPPGGVAAQTGTPAATSPESCLRIGRFPVPAGDHPHDVAPAADGMRIWYTAQAAGALGLLDPATGDVQTIPLGEGSAPHGVIVGPDKAAWVTDSGLNAIVRVDPETFAVERWPLVEGGANLNTAVFDPRRSPLVHRAEWRGRPARPGPATTRHPAGDSSRAEGSRTIRDYRYSRWDGLLRFAGGELPRPGRPRRRRRIYARGNRAADAGAGHAPGLERFDRRGLDERVERRPGWAVRPGRQ